MQKQCLINSRKSKANTGGEDNEVAPLSRFFPSEALQHRLAC